MSLDCFGSNYIGILGDCSNANEIPSSGLYVNHISGVSLHLASKVSDAEYNTGVSMLKTLLDEAIRLTCNEFLCNLKGFSFNSITDLKSTGRHNSDFIENTYQGEQGFEFELATNDRFQELYIESINVNSDENRPAVDFLIIDGCEVTRKTFDLVCGFNELRMEYAAKGSKVQIVTDISTWANVPSTYYNNSVGGCNCKCYDDNGNDCYTIRSIQKLGTQANYEYGGNSAGMVVNSQCRCSESKFICQFKDKLSFAIRLRMAALFFKEVVTTTRNNPLANVQENIARERFAEIMGGDNPTTGFKENSEYWAELKRIAKQSEVAINKLKSKCIDCQRTKIIYSKR